MARNAAPVGTLDAAVARAVWAALAEDATAQDVTTVWTVPSGLRLTGRVEARAAGTVAGLSVVAEVYGQLDPDVVVRNDVKDGVRVKPGDQLLTVDGPARSIITGERVALNFLQRMSGIATAAAAYVDEVQDLPVSILDTRKTAPGLRALDKYAVVCGGANNHRPDLAAMVLAKENHLAAAGGVVAAIDAIRRNISELGSARPEIEVEVTSLEQARQALECQIDWVLLDNMTLADMRAAVRLRDSDTRFRKTRLEASGNVTLATVRSIALTGVDAISIGALTHSPDALDLSLLVQSPQVTR
jgi:nicotinate-nucleotide pyrophosphorylase (carboxylating)